MSKTLVVFAHPGNKGHNTKILEKVEEYLELRRENYEVLDLYHEKEFDPLLRYDEHYVHNEKVISQKVLEYQKKIRESDKLIFVHPVWWNSPPAVLNGFFEKVWTPGFSFKYVHVIGDLGRPVGLLPNKKAVVFQTINSPRWLHYLVQGARAKKIMSQDFLGFAGIKNKIWLIDKCLKLTPKQEKKISKRVSKGISWLYK